MLAVLAELNDMVITPRPGLSPVDTLNVAAALEE